MTDNRERKMGILYSILEIIILGCAVILILEIYINTVSRKSKRAKILKVLVPLFLLIYLIICVLDGFFGPNIDDVEIICIAAGCMTGCTGIFILWLMLNNV